MKMKRVLSLLLALVMTFSLLTLPSYAEDEDTAEETTSVEAVTSAEDAALAEDESAAEEVTHVEDDFSALTVAEQYAALMAMEDEAAIEAAYNTLTTEQQNDLLVYAAEVNGFDTTPVQELNVVSSSVVAPLVKVDAEPAMPAKKAPMKAPLKAAPAPDSTSNQETDAGHEGLFLNKNVTKNTDGSYTLRLESYVTGNVTISTETTTLPSDIVLVLDVSGSMDENITVGSKSDTSELDTRYGAAEGVYTITYPLSGDHVMRYQNGKWQYRYIFWRDVEDSVFGSSIKVSKLNALKIATKNFVDQVQAQAIKDGVDHKISIVTYSSNSAIVQNLTSVTSTTNANAVKNNIDRLSANGATRADLGMGNAKTIINGITRESNKVVIMFTDGVPTSGNTFENTVANATIANSKAIKDKGAWVYTIGVLDDANDTVPMPGNASNVNKYMHYVSSNFKNANNMTDPGTATYPGGNQSYYLAASNADQISGIFKQISEQIATGGASRVLGTSTVVKDVVTQAFDLPNNTSGINVYTADYLGYEADGTTRRFAAPVKYTGANVNIDGQTVSVSNFDYSSAANCVTDTKNSNGTTTYSGKKLIVEFKITPDMEFLGGNQVPTNENTSGVYENNTATTAVGTFVVPKTNVDIPEVTVTAADKNVYLTGSLTKEQLLDGAIVMCGDVDITDPSKLQDWQKAYVTIADSATGFTNLTDDETYTVSATVSPKTDGTAETKTGSATAKVNVFKPEVNFKDSTIYQGNTADYSVNKTDTPVWKHGTTVDSAVTMTGTKPNLSYDYSEAAAAFTDCTPVAVTVKIGTTDVTNKTNGKKDFTVHVLQPTVTATVKDVQKYYGEDYTLGDGANGSINVDWKDAHDDHSNIPNAIGTKPYEAEDLSLAYTTTAFSGQTGTVPNKDFDVTVKVMKGTQEMTDATITTSCTYGCGADQTDGKYTVHVKTCTLTIKKVIGGGGLDQDQSFIFNVKAGPYNRVKIDPIKVTIQGEGSVTITGLPVGNYTVAEDDNWSWRYWSIPYSEEFSMERLGYNHTIEFDNYRKKTQWLSGENFAINAKGEVTAHGTFVSGN